MKLTGVTYSTKNLNVNSLVIGIAAAIFAVPMTKFSIGNILYGAGFRGTLKLVTKK